MDGCYLYGQNRHQPQNTQLEPQHVSSRLLPAPASFIFILHLHIDWLEGEATFRLRFVLVVDLGGHSQGELHRVRVAAGGTYFGEQSAEHEFLDLFDRKSIGQQRRRTNVGGREDIYHFPVRSLSLAADLVQVFELAGQTIDPFAQCLVVVEFLYQRLGALVVSESREHEGNGCKSQRSLLRVL